MFSASRLPNFQHLLKFLRKKIAFETLVLRNLTLREKCRYSISVQFQSECGKIRTRKNPDTDTFHGVPFSKLAKICLCLLDPIVTKLTFTCSKSTRETLGKRCEICSAQQQKHQNDVNNVVLAFSLLRLNILHTLL